MARAYTSVLQMIRYFRSRFVVFDFIISIIARNIPGKARYHSLRRVSDGNGGENGNSSCHL